MPTPIIIDCDPGLDDAVAIALAAASNQLNVQAITTVAGNASIDMVTENAVALCEALGVAAPVYRGSEGPLLREPRHGTTLWGGDGSLGLRRATGAASEGAVARLERLLEAAGERSVAICPVGPLTNIARLFNARPELASKVARLVVMGGALGEGNVTPHAEFNIWFDPHSAAAVFAADIPAVLIPYDVTRKVVIEGPHVERLRRAQSAPARVCAELLPLAGMNSHPSSIHDACVIGYLLWPELFQCERGKVEVIMDGEEEGRTRLTPHAAGWHQVATSLDLQTFLDRLVEELVRA
jgi:purine nucleosidase